MKGWDVTSPSGKQRLTFSLDGQGRLFYSLQKGDQMVLKDSPIWFELSDADDLHEGLAFVSFAQSDHQGQWENPFGENRWVDDTYRQCSLSLKDEAGRMLTVTARAYDGGVAWRYTIEGEGGIALRNEHTCFRLAQNGMAHCTYTAQGSYEKRPVSLIGQGCERPLTIELNGGTCIAICEAALVDYARMKLSVQDVNTIVSSLSAKSLYKQSDPEAVLDIPERERIKYQGTLPLTTPWRVVLVADCPAALYMSKDILQNLNEPCAIEDTSFIVPGKVLRIMPLTTENGIACVDFASKHKLQYVEIDAGWYGPEFDPASDATFVSVDPKRYAGPFDMFRIIDYAKEKGLRVILYINHQAMLKQLDTLLPLFKSWNVDGVKYGFVDVGPQKWTAWLHECVRKAAENRLVLTIHDEYRPTGYSRTFPNLLTQEGIRGDEERQPVSNTMEIVFTRMLAGAGDHTICYGDERVDLYWSHGIQLAKAVVLFSPLQFLFWYDHPAVIPPADELRFFEEVPTVWDKTLVLAGEIGEYVAMARCAGERWFVGVINANTDREITIDLSFLEKGAEYWAELFFDDDKAAEPTRVSSRTLAVDSKTILPLAIKCDNGVAIRIYPK